MNNKENTYIDLLIEEAIKEKRSKIEENPIIKLEIPEYTALQILELAGMFDFSTKNITQLAIAYTRYILRDNLITIDDLKKELNLDYEELNLDYEELKNNKVFLREYEISYLEQVELEKLGLFNFEGLTEALILGTEKLYKNNKLIK